MSSATELINGATRKVFGRPFLTFLALSLFVWAVSLSITLDETGLLSLLALTVVTAYIHIAVILAAVTDDPPAAIDPWLRSAFKQRCFWRLAFTELFAILLVAAGALALVFPAFLIGAAVALSAQAAVLERKMPADAVRRSLELTKPVRKTAGVVFGLLNLVPLLVTQVGLQLRWDRDYVVGWVIFQGVTVALTMIGVVALSMLYAERAASETAAQVVTG